MLDSNVIKTLFTLLRSGLWDKEIDHMECFPMSHSEWKMLYRIAVEQTVEGIVYDGIQKLPIDLLPPRDIMLIWVVRLNKIEAFNSQMDKSISHQIKFFGRLGVKPILLKGQAVASFYRIPSHRVCGDIDWYFNNTQEAEHVKESLRKLNVQFSNSTVDSLNYRWNSSEVEHHTKLLDIFNPIARKKLEKICNHVLNDDFFTNKRATEYQILPPELNIIQVNLHILKHLLSFGIGLRQLCDSAILYDQLDYNKDELLKVYTDIKILNWIYVLHDLLVKYIGLAENKLPFSLNSDYSSDWMLNDILSTGNFGFYDIKHSVFKQDNTFYRKNKSIRLWYSFRKYFPLAPYEAICFPFVHFSERFKFLKVG